jgi:hypothetical protein
MALQELVTGDLRSKFKPWNGKEDHIWCIACGVKGLEGLPLWEMKQPWTEVERICAHTNGHLKGAVNADASKVVPLFTIADAVAAFPPPPSSKRAR